MAIDFVIITLVILFFIRGYMKGIILAAFSVLAIVLGIICALKLSERLATFLFEQGYVTNGWAQYISYIILFTGVVLLVRLAAKAIETGLDMAMMGWVNRGFGGLLYAFVAVVACSALLWLSTKMQFIQPETIAASKTYEYVSPVAPWVAGKVGKLWPVAKDVFADLQLFFDNVNTSLPADVGSH